MKKRKERSGLTTAEAEAVKQYDVIHVMTIEFFLISAISF